MMRLGLRWVWLRVRKLMLMRMRKWMRMLMLLLQMLLLMLRCVGLERILLLLMDLVLVLLGRRRELGGVLWLNCCCCLQLPRLGLATVVFDRHRLSPPEWFLDPSIDGIDGGIDGCKSRCIGARACAGVARNIGGPERLLLALLVLLRLRLLRLLRLW